MHTIKEKPVVVNGEIVIRPIMVVALTYDHRLLDGREAVTFLGKYSLILPMPFLAAVAHGATSSFLSQNSRLHRGSRQDAPLDIIEVGDIKPFLSLYPSMRTYITS